MIEFYLSIIYDPKYNDDFKDIYTKYEQYMLKIAKSYTSDHQYVEDTLQIAFTNIAIYIYKLKPLAENERKAYITKIIRNAALRVIKKNKSNVETVSINYEMQSKENLVEHFVKKDEVLRIKQFIKNMPTKFRYVIYLHIFNNLNFREIAKILFISESTAKSRFYKGIEIVQQKFKEENYD